MQIKTTRTDAAKAFGSHRKLAEAIGISVQALYQWPEELPERKQNEILGLMYRRHLAEKSVDSEKF